MIKSLLILLLLLSNLTAKDNYELKLFEKVIPLIFDSKIINVYVDSDTQEIIEESTILHIRDNCDEIDLIISKKELENIRCKDIPLFATSLNAYKDSKNSIGAFYWRKGRPQLKLNAEIIKKFNLNLPKSLEKYAK